MRPLSALIGVALGVCSLPAIAGEPVPRFEPGKCAPSAASVEELKDARCGYLVVAESRARDRGRTIRLPVAILPAASESPAAEPLVHLSGGPGGDVFAEAKYLVEAGYNRDHEIIIMAQRGTLDTEPELTCPEVDRFNIEAIGMSYDAATTEARHLAATRACRDRLVAQGIDLTAYNTFENAADFSDLRRALKIARWNVHAYSYGTYLALTMMRTHPEGLRSVIVDSVLPPSLVTFGWTWASVKEAFDNLVRACEEQAACRERYPDLAGTFTRLVKKQEASPLKVSVTPQGASEPVDVVIDGGALVAWIVGARPPLSKIPSAIAELEAGNPTQIAEARALLTDSDQIGHFAHGMSYSVFCSEWAPVAPASEILEQGRRAFPGFPDSVLALAPQMPFMHEDCEIWDVPAAPPAIREVTRSDIPTLVLSGSFDLRTSPLGGAYVARTLSKATNVVIPGVGHWAAVWSSCAQSVIQSFLTTPEAPNTSCVGELTSPTFD